jgi:iron complex outermembrane receptor protein
MLQRSASRTRSVTFLAFILAVLIPTFGVAQSADTTSSQPAAKAAPPAGQQATGTAQPPSQQKPAQPKPAAADQKEKPPAEGQPPLRMDVEVVVTAPRMDIPIKDNPAATTVVTEDNLKSMPRGVGAEEALALVPGVKVDNQADGERVHLSIRGQGLLTERGVRGIKVLLDGLPLNDPSGFAPDLFDVDWQTVQRIEVLRGSASALYGGGSSGGVINISTRDGGTGKATPEFDVTGGSYSFLKGLAEVGGTAGKVNYRVSASENTGDGYRLHTNFHATNLYGKFKVKASESTTLTAIVAGTVFYNGNAEGLNLAWFSQDLGQGVDFRRQANPDSLTFNEYQRTRRITAGVSGNTVLAPNQSLAYAVYYRNTGWVESVPSSVQHRTYNTPGFNVRYNLRTDHGTIKNHLTLGSDIDFQSIDDYRVANLGNAVEGPTKLSNQTIDQRGVGFYALDQVDLTPEWGVMFGVRADRIHNQLQDLTKAGGVDLSGKADFSKATARVGASWNPRSDVGLYASWGQGFMPPATEELANNPDSLGGFNTHLVPATSQGEEFGVRGGRSGFSYDVAVFHLATDNDFGRYRVTSRPLETFYGNLGTTRRYGLETLVGYFPRADVRLQLAYTLSDFKYTQVQSLFGSFTGKVMPNAPRHQVTLDAEYTFHQHWVIGVNVFAQSLQYVDQTNIPSINGFGLLNPRLAYRWSTPRYNGEFMLTARNITGTKYIAFTEPDPDGNSYQPGPTEEFFLGVHFRFGK